MKKVPCEEYLINDSVVFKITDKSLIGRSFYIQGSNNGESWVNIPWGASDPDEDYEDDDRKEKDFSEYVIEDVPMSVFTGESYCTYHRLVFKEEEF